MHGAHATQNVEYGGPGLASLSINARKTLTTMSAELSAEFATFEADEAMLAWIRERNPSAKLEPVHPDKDAKYLAVRKVDLGSLEPGTYTVVAGHEPARDAAARKEGQEDEKPDGHPAPQAAASREPAEVGCAVMR